MVFVDDMCADFGRMKMCHMTAHTTRELFEMADKIAVQRKWIQKAGTSHEHFDICLSKRKRAVAEGAQQITWKQTCEFIQWKEKQLG